MADLEEFIARYQPLIRPEGTMTRVRFAMKIDEDFKATFHYVRGQLRAESERWPDALVHQMVQFRDFSDRMSDQQMDVLRDKFRKHQIAILNNKFDEAYFRSIEEITLFFIYYDLRAVWLVGAMKQVVEASIQRLYDKRNGGGRSVIFTLITYLTLELSQVQRVYIRYAEIKDHETPDPTGKITIST